MGTTAMAEQTVAVPFHKKISNHLISFNMSRFFKFATAVLFGCITTSAGAQTPAMDFNTTDCNGNTANLFADLDAGKAVVLFYFMPNCGSCPPPAQKIQAMAQHINAIHPDKVKAYAFPFNNTTACSYSQSWVSSNNLSWYAPMDSGAAAVAHYGGFGMPTVVLVGGNNHRVMFSTLSFSTSDTTIMRDSILALIGGAPTGLDEVSAGISDLNVYPNPAPAEVNIAASLKAQSHLIIDVVDITGKRVLLVSDEKNAAGSIKRSFDTQSLANGVYTVRFNVNGRTVNRKLNVVH